MNESLQSLRIQGPVEFAAPSEFLLMDRAMADIYCDGAIAVGARFALEVTRCADNVVVFKLVRFA